MMLSRKDKGKKESKEQEHTPEQPAKQPFSPEAFSREKGQAARVEHQRGAADAELTEMEALEREVAELPETPPLDPELADLAAEVEADEIAEQEYHEELREEFGGLSQEQLEREYERLSTELIPARERALRDRQADARRLVAEMPDVGRMSERDIDDGLTPEEHREVEDEFRALEAEVEGRTAPAPSDEKMDEELMELEQQIQPEDLLPSEVAADEVASRLQRLNDYMTMQAVQEVDKVSKRLGQDMGM